MNLIEVGGTSAVLDRTAMEDIHKIALGRSSIEASHPSEAHLLECIESVLDHWLEHIQEEGAVVGLVRSH